MKKVERGSVKYLVILIVALAVAGAILFPMFDLIWSKVVTNSEFSYSAEKYVIEPISFGAIFGLIFWAIDRPKKKK